MKKFNELAKNPITVARQILWLRGGSATTPMHVLKLVYIAHGWMLGIFDKPLITESPEAWRYGPVVPSVYHQYKEYGGSNITEEYGDLSKLFETEQTDLIDAVLYAYRDHSALDLSAITHQPGTPWSKVYDGGKGQGLPIPDELIQDYYKKLAESRVTRNDR